MSLGKKLNQKAINTANAKIAEVNKLIEEKNAKSTPATTTDTTTH